MENEECVCFSGMLMMIIWLMNEMKRDTCEYMCSVVGKESMFVTTTMWKVVGEK